jgi:hypothetical protein
MKVHRLERKIAVDEDEDEAGSAALREILWRLQHLERRLEMLEGRSTKAAGAPTTLLGVAAQYPLPAGGAHATAAEELRNSARDNGPDSARGLGSDGAPKTERLDRMPFISAAADNPFPDLSLLEQKLAPAKGPARRIAVRAAIEDHPRIAQRIEQLWGTSECEQYLNTLIIDNRGNRQGFPPAVLEELLYLGRLARALVILQVGGDVWASYDRVGDRR